MATDCASEPDDAPGAAMVPLPIASIKRNRPAMRITVLLQRGIRTVLPTPVKRHQGFVMPFLTIFIWIGEQFRADFNMAPRLVCRTAV